MKYIWKAQEWLMNEQLKEVKHIKLLKCFKYSVFGCFCIFSLMNQTKFSLFFLIIILFFSYLSQKEGVVACLTSVRKYSTFCLVMTLLSVLLTLSVMLIFSSISGDGYNILFVFLIVPIFFYCIITLFANTDVSTLVNGMYAGVLAIIMFVINKIISFMSTDILSDFVSNYLGESINFLINTCIKNNIISSYSVGLDFIFTIIILPLFLMFSSATLVCIIKKYWIKKYNHNIDLVDMNQLKDEIKNIAFEKDIYYPFIAFTNYKEGLDLLEYYKNLQSCDEYNDNINSILYVYYLLAIEKSKNTIIY